MCRKTKIAVGRRSGRNAEQATFKQKSRASFLYDPVMYVTRGCTIVTYSIDAFRLSWEGPNLWRSLQAAAWVPFRHVKYWMCEVTSICRTDCRHKNMPDWKDNGSRRLLEVTGFILHNTCTQKMIGFENKKDSNESLDTYKDNCICNFLPNLYSAQMKLVSLLISLLMINCVSICNKTRSELYPH
jgi:hypothetical protein